MKKLFIALSILALSSGCAFEVHSVGTGNGGLEGDGPSEGTGLDARFNAVSPGRSEADAGVDTPTVDDVVDTPVLDAPLVDDPVLDEIVEVNDPVDVVVQPLTCTPASEAADCPGTSCDPATMQCSTFKRGSRPGCWTCVSDSDCEEPDHRCVEMDYQGVRFPDDKTGFCMQIAVPEDDEDDLDFDDADDSNCVTPFTTVLVNRPSLSGGVTQSYCGIREALTTCYGVRSFQNQELCPGGRDDECPVGAFCRRFGSGSKAVNCCSYECTADNQCIGPYGEASECGGYCGG
jgi:hypothetical protein